MAKIYVPGRWIRCNSLKIIAPNCKEQLKMRCLNVKLLAPKVSKIIITFYIQRGIIWNTHLFRVSTSDDRSYEDTSARMSRCEITD